MQRNNWTNLAEGDDGGGRVSHRLGGLMAQEAGCSLPAGARTPKAILKSEPLYARTHTHTQLLETMTEDDGHSCRGGTSQV